MSFNSLYTFSKSIDDSSTFGGAGNTVAQNDKDISAERGLSSFNQTHVLNTNWVMSTPRTARRFLRDWTLSGGVTLASGTPLTARVLGNQADAGGTGSVGSGRAESTGLPVTAGAGFFNLGAFTIPPSGHFGDAGRNTIPGPGSFSLNAAIGRSIAITERRRVELRLETNNLTNHVNFSNLATIVNASNYGLPVAAGSMRTMQATVRFRF